MKNKIIYLVIVIAFIVKISSFQCVFADEITPEERVEIIEGAKRGWTIYETIGGPASAATAIVAPNGWLMYRTDDINEKNTDDGAENFNEVLLFERECISEITDPSSKLYMFSENEGTFYIKTRFHSIDELEQYIDSVFAGNVFNDKSWNDSRIQRIVEKGGNVYLKTLYTYAAVFPVEFDFDTADINIVGNTATVTLELSDGYKMSISIDTDLSRTIVLKNNSGNWEICGGSAFFADVESELSASVNKDGMYEVLYKDEYPQTGDNSVLYIVIAASALVTMSAMVFRRKRKVT